MSLWRHQTLLMPFLAGPHVTNVTLAAPNVTNAIPGGTTRY